MPHGTGTGRALPFSTLTGAFRVRQDLTRKALGGQGGKRRFPGGLSRGLRQRRFAPVWKTERRDNRRGKRATGAARALRAQAVKGMGADQGGERHGKDRFSRSETKFSRFPRSTACCKPF